MAKLCHFLFAAAWLGWISISSAATPGAMILSLRGQVEYQPVGTTNWVPAHTNLVMKVRDRLRTHELSDATLQLADFSIIRISEFSLIEIVPPREYSDKSRFSLRQGLFYFFHRTDRPDTELETPTANAAIEGTEFAAEVAADGTTRLVLVDGRVSLSNQWGQVQINAGEVGLAAPGQAPQKSPALDVFNLIPWTLYYPGVIAPTDLALTQAAKNPLASTLKAYQQGDLLASLKAWPSLHQPDTADEQLFYAGLLLACGRSTNIQTLVSNDDQSHPLFVAIQYASAATQSRLLTTPFPATNASQFLGRSYYRQSWLDLAGALADAQAAVNLAPEFGFAWARLAEMEFSHGDYKKADAALDRALQLSPRNAQAHALRGFIRLARNQPAAAEAAFEAAIALDGQLANGWLGRGLSRIAQGQAEAGRTDLQAAVAAEPGRWVLRSYVARAYSAQADAARDKRARQRLLEKARQELEVAKVKATNDPTPWLYSALLAHQQYRTCDAIQDLERSVELNDNRQVYRSRLLLDQDQAVRSANLAQIYEAAGMSDVARRESARSVMFDYANYSAHYNLAGSFFNLRDPTRFHLSHETEWLNEHLLASLLSPMGGGSLSQNLSQDEYARVFQRKKFGLSSSTEYYSTGEWREMATHFGTLDNLSYAFDLDYQYKDGTRANHDLSRLEWYSRIKLRLSPRDSLLLLTKYQDYESGDQFQHFDFNTPRPNFRFREEQMPWLFAGYHREWSPGIHTLALAGRLVNDQRFTDSAVLQMLAYQSAALDPNKIPFDMALRTDIEIYSGELKQIFQREKHTDILGIRYQSGDIAAESTLDNVVPAGIAPFFNLPVNSALDRNFERFSLYAYHHWDLRENLVLSGGVAYDRLEWPENYRRPPLSSGGRTRDLVSPKAALIWNPSRQVTLRGAYARSLGGVSAESDLRLEPTQLAGFSQSFRTLISETTLGSVEAPLFDMAGGALDLQFKTGTYMTFEGQWKQSLVDRDFGYFNYDAFRLPPPAIPAQSLERLDYREIAAKYLLNQRLADCFFFEAGYQFTHSALERELVDIPATPTYDRHNLSRSDLHELHGALLFIHNTGLFARAETRWFHQDNDAGMPDSDFPMLNFYAGYRFRHRAELTLGLLNATDREYQLQSLNYYQEMPRERTFYLRLKINF